MYHLLLLSNKDWAGEGCVVSHYTSWGYFVVYWWNAGTV